MFNLQSKTLSGGLFACLMAVFLLGIGIDRVQAQCTVTSSVGDDDTITCNNTDADGINTGVGNDSVTIVSGATVQDAIRKNGNGQLALIIQPGGTLNSGGFGVFLVGDIDFTNSGHITAATIGIRGRNGQTTVNTAGNIYAGTDGIRIDSGDVTIAGNIYAGRHGIFIGGDGNVTSTGNIFAEVSGIYVGGNGNVGSEGNIDANQDYGIFIGGNGNATSTGDIDAGLTGIRISGDGDVDSEGNIIADTGHGIIIYGSGNVTSTGVIDADISGIHVGGDGNVSSTGDIDAGSFGIHVVGSGTVINIGDIAAGEYGIVIEGDGDVVSSGGIVSGIDGIIVVGTGNITNTGDIIAPNYGIGTGNGDILNFGDITTNAEASIYINQNGDVTNTGDLSSLTFDGIHIGGSGTVDNSGNVDAGAFGIYIANSGAVDNTGDILADEYGIGIANGSILNSGNIDAGMYGIYIDADGVVLNEGNIIADLNGIDISEGVVVNEGDITAAKDGIYVMNDGVVAHSGNIDAAEIGIGGENGQQVIVIEGVVKGDSGSVSTAGGDDVVVTNTNAVLIGDVRLGEGNDLFIIMSGTQIDGTVYGGEDVGGQDVDELVLPSERVCREYPETGKIDNYDPDSGTVTVDGQTYTWTEFEAITAMQQVQVTCHPFIDDGRINKYDHSAPIAGYCNVENGVNIWDINLQSEGRATLSVSGADMHAALKVAVETGEHQLIAEGTAGNQLWALSSNEFQMMGPEIREPHKQYVFIFPPERCGLP